jgi:His-Xaa-Ser system radical SAM maturase HxsB
LIFTDEGGGWFASSEEFLDRYVAGKLTAEDHTFLLRGGHAFERELDLYYSSFLRRWTARHATPAEGISYLILVPTLRCNLACDYCQVSRAAEGAKGFDWNEATLERTLAFIDGLQTQELKVEFQGGEPLLRLDLLSKVRDFCKQRFKHTSFVVCSNLQRLDDAAWTFFEDEGTSLSTSIDGDVGVQTRQRTQAPRLSETFFSNVEAYVSRFGTNRISALPTVDLRDPVDPNVLIETYDRFGLRSIYLRPVNRQGFARRAPLNEHESSDWAAYHRRFVRALIDWNFEHEHPIEEFYLSHAIRRVLRPAVDGHVDLRNPAPVGNGYVVVDYDGTLYPSDEARMMSRVGQVDLSIGTVATGIERDKVEAINVASFNDFDPDCQHCAFQPYCGTDVVDDISRYGRIDIPRIETLFCKRHLSLFDLVFELLRSQDELVIHSMKKWAAAETWPAHLAQVYR